MLFHELFIQRDLLTRPSHPEVLRLFTSRIRLLLSSQLYLKPIDSNEWYFYTFQILLRIFFGRMLDRKPFFTFLRLHLFFNSFSLCFLFYFFIQLHSFFSSFQLLLSGPLYLTEGPCWLYLQILFLLGYHWKSNIEFVFCAVFLLISCASHILAYFSLPVWATYRTRTSYAVYRLWYFAQ